MEFIINWTIYIYAYKAKDKPNHNFLTCITVENTNNYLFTPMLNTNSFLFWLLDEFDLLILVNIASEKKM